jgi:hypothetical protein
MKSQVLTASKYEDSRVSDVRMSEVTPGAGKK